mgnify:FL=1
MQRVQEKVIKVLVSDLDLENVRPQRAGVILVSIENDIVYFGLGVDRKSGDFTDFGGHVEKSDPNVVYSALREFHEETLGIFGGFDNVGPDNIAENLSIYDNKNFIAFIRVDEPPTIINHEFNIQSTQHENLEVQEIVWFTCSNFKKLVAGRLPNVKMYHRVREFLGRSGDFYPLI